MDRNAKKAVLKNRVKLLNLDYFDLTAPMLASEHLPSKKHKEIKTSALDSKARVDLLLEWLEESAPKEAFPIFLQGVRNCKELILAKKIKREASGSGLASGAAGTSASNIPLDQLLADIVPGLPSTVGKPPAGADKPKKPKAPKLKLPKVIPPTTSGPAPINGLPAANLPPPPVPKAKKRKAADDSGAKASPGGLKVATKAAKKVNGTPKAERSRGTTPKGTPATAAAVAAAAAAAAAAAIVGTPRATRKSSSSDTVQAKNEGKGKKGPAKKAKQEKEGPSTSAASPKAPKVAVKPMTFKEVEDKQQDFKTKFKFTNDNAVAKSILFKDKSDITYLGCPSTTNNKMCGKKVELKSKEFICEAKHKSPNCRQIPRLQVTCSDGTADLVLTLMKQNVEIFTGKTENDIETMSVDDIKTVLDKTLGKVLNVEVASEKAKKQGTKKGAGIKWNNVATIIGNDAPPSKKKRKN